MEAQTNSNELQQEFKLSDIESKINAYFKSYDFSPFQMHQALFCFEEDAIGEIVSLIHRCKLPKKYSSYKDYLREKLFIKFKCMPNDLIIFDEGMIYVKLYFQLEQANQTERRACGLPQDLLDKYKQKYFDNNHYRQDILELLPHVIEDVLNFRKINPSEFKKIFVPTLVNMVEIVVIAQTNIEDLRIVRGLTFYLLREMFDEMMLLIAEDILFHFSNADRKAVEFLSCFSLNETIDAQGNRYKPNPILDESNYAWNMTTIRSTLLQYKRAKQALFDKKNGLVAIKKKLELHKIAEKEIQKDILVIQEQQQEIDLKIQSLHRTLQKLQETQSEEVMFTEDGVEKIFPRNVLIAKLFKKEDNFFSDKNKLKRSLDEMALKIANKQKEIDVWEKKYDEGKAQLSSLEANGHPIDKQYERIQRALAKTLASR